MTTSHDAGTESLLNLEVLDLFHRSGRHWIVSGSLQQGTLRQGQRVRFTFPDDSSARATVLEFNLCTVQPSRLDFLVRTDTFIEPLLPATIIAAAVYDCPVCGGKYLEVAPYKIWPPPPGVAISPPYEDFLGSASYEVCPQCGFEFCFDDNPGTAPGDSFEQYREDWVAQGRPCFDVRGRTAARSEKAARVPSQRPLAQRQLLGKVAPQISGTEQR